MMRNNFDQSSTGVNIELVAHYDCDLAHDEFNENFKRLNISNSFYYVDYGNAKMPENIDGCQSVNIRGYSQGDYATVYYNAAELKEIWGVEPKEKELKETFTHLFYDAPIHAIFTIDGEEYRYELNLYDFQREDWLEIVSKESGVAIETLSAMCPETLEYE